MSRIVVGIDGSAESKRALRWAGNEARLRGARLRVVHVWALPHPFRRPGVDPALEADVIEMARRVAQDLVENELDALGDEVTGIDVTHAVVEGAPAPALLEAAEGADLLVVGSRGRGGFAALLLGSVSQQCAQHAPCPLVIVPPGRSA